MNAWRIVISMMIVLIGSVFIQPPAVQACTGGETPLDAVFPYITIAAQGEFAEVDTQHTSGIFRVEQYLTGTGPQYILVNTYSFIRQLQNVEENRINDPCDSFTRLNATGSYILFMNRDEYGTYQPYHHSSVYWFPTPDAEVTPLLSYVDDETGTYNLEAFGNYVAAQTNSVPTLPDVRRPRPIKAPLILRTSLERYYILPVDGSHIIPMNENEYAANWLLPHGCYSAPCTAASPDGHHKARLLPDEPPNVQPLPESESALIFPPDNSQPARISYSASHWQRELELIGSAMLFSPTSDAIALWAEDQLFIYSLYYPRRWLGAVGLLNTRTLAADRHASTYIGRAAWSTNGRMLAYTDAEGLWIWDAVTSGSLPRLVLPYSYSRLYDERSIPLATEFSAHGRYLTITEAAQRYVLDLTTGERFPDGFVSPDERILLVLDTLNHDNGISYFSLTQRHSEENPLMLLPGQRIQQVEWMNEYFYLAVGCRALDDSMQFHPSERRFRPWCHVIKKTTGNFYFEPVSEGYWFNYHSQTGDVVALVDDTTIAINGEKRYLAGQIRGEIVDAIWMPALFLDFASNTVRR